MRFEYPVNITEESGEFLVSFIDFPEAITSGVSLQDAQEEAQDALEEAIAGRINRGEEIPWLNKQSIPDNCVLIPVQPQFAMKAIIHIKRLESKMSKCDLARTLEIDEKEVRRILDPKHNTKLTTLQKVLRMLGFQVVTDAYKLVEFSGGDRCA